MKKLHLVLIALAGLASAAHAQSGLPSAGLAAPGGGQQAVMEAMAPQTSGPIVRNANDCPPDRPEAVWGANGVLLGYACVTPSAN
jgi:hypothetical protein